MTDLTVSIPLHFCKGESVLRFNKVKLLSLILFGLLISDDVGAKSIVSARVTSVFDGNTIEVVTSDKRNLKVLLYGIDSPELGQRFGNEARKYLEDKLLNRDVSMEIRGKDSFGNYLAIVTLDNRVDIRVDLLKEGLAWTAEKDGVSDLEPYRTWAQRKGRGLWREQNPVPPWTYRRQQAMQKPKIR